MPLPQRTRAQLESIRVQCARERPVWGDRKVQIPVDRYMSPSSWQREIEGLFRPLPLIAAHASELQSGQVLAHDAYGVPLLLARDGGGRVRAFLNVCRHRGMRLVAADGVAQPRSSIVCPYHGWTYRLDGTLRHMLHADAFDPCADGARDLVPLPCEERHGLVWVVPRAGGRIDLDAWLAGLDAELPFYGIGELTLFRKVEAEYPANWKLIVDAFLEPYHIRVLHRDTIAPFFTDGITATERFGPHIASMVARKAAQEWAAQADPVPPETLWALCKVASPTHMIFPNTVTIFHPDYLSLVTLYPTGPESLRWTHRMLIPREKSTPDWEPHWARTLALVDQGVFQREDIHCAVEIQKGFASGANAFVTAGRMEHALAWFHGSVDEYTAP